MLQGASYELEVRMRDCAGAVLTDAGVERAVFQIGGIEKFYGDGGEVFYDRERGAWIVPLSEEETYTLSGAVKWQAKFLFESGLSDLMVPKTEYVYESIIKKVLKGGDTNA